MAVNKKYVDFVVQTYKQLYIIIIIIIIIIRRRIIRIRIIII